MKPIGIYTAYALMLTIGGTQGLLISKNKDVEKSSEFPPGRSDGDGASYKAVDGIKDRNTSACHCCAATDHEPSWFRVDLGKDFFIESFEILGRLQPPNVAYYKLYHHFQNLNISLIDETNKITYQKTIQEKVYVVTESISPPVEARYVHMFNPTDGHFVLCEISVYGDCVDGRFGDDCNSSCYCKSGPCNKTTGICPDGGCLSGYYGDTCSIVCQDRTYGENCAESCGSCANNDSCDTKTGHCNDCALGYMKDDFCKTECEDGTYGYSCLPTCSGNCLDGLPCDKVDGHCDMCAAGFTGSKCDLGLLISKNKDVEKSSEYPPGGPDGDGASYKAVDGIKDRDAFACQCCAFTDHEPSWFHVDLGKDFVIESFEILGRLKPPNVEYENLYQHFRNLNISLIDETNKTTYQKTIQEKVYIVTESISPPVEARYVHMFNPNDGHFALCEISVYGDCVDGSFGDDCNSICHCKNGPCNKITGICPAGGCASGYYGDTCSTVCQDRTYGENCAESCGNCANNDSCDTKTGHCNFCAPGYMKDDLCKTECKDGTYGYACLQSCSGNCLDGVPCDKVNGHCGLCAAGFRESKCDVVCINGTFGYNCEMTCGSCKNDRVCSKTHGTCPSGCKAGFKLDTCLEECDDGQFGENCVFTCGACLNESPCNKTTGLCDEGCAPGYNGTYCTNGYAEPKISCAEVKTYQIGTAIGGSVALVLIIGVIVVAVYYVIRLRRKHRDELKRSPPDISNLYEIPNQRSLESNGQYDTAAPVYEVSEQLYENAQ